MFKFNLCKHIINFVTGRQEKAAAKEFLEFFNKGQYQNAYKILIEIIERNPQHPQIGDLYVQCADLELIINDDIKKAKEFLDKAKGFNCQAMDAYYRCYGYILCRTGENERGIEYLEKSATLNPTCSSLIPLGKELSNVNDKRAFDIWQKVLTEEPNSCIAYIYLAWGEYKSGNRDKALLMISKAKELNPTNSDYYEIGRLFSEMEEYQSALDAYFKADELGDEPKGLTYAVISYCYYAMGEKDLAKKYIQMAMKYNPENDVVQKVLEGLKNEGLNYEKDKQ
jgi:tetratricopeptide (TPR) repeat protein